MKAKIFCYFIGVYLRLSAADALNAFFRSLSA
jgi:hypothetical protein